MGGEQRASTVICRSEIMSKYQFLAQLPPDAQSDDVGPMQYALAAQIRTKTAHACTYMYIELLLLSSR